MSWESEIITKHSNEERYYYVKHCWFSSHPCKLNNKLFIWFPCVHTVPVFHAKVERTMSFQKLFFCLDSETLDESSLSPFVRNKTQSRKIVFLESDYSYLMLFLLLLPVNIITDDSYNIYLFWMLGWIMSESFSLNFKCATFMVICW